MIDEPKTIVMKFAATTEKTARALKFLGRTLEEAADSAPWNADLQRAAKAARYIRKHLTIVNGEPQ